MTNHSATTESLNTALRACRRELFRAVTAAVRRGYAEAKDEDYARIEKLEAENENYAAVQDANTAADKDIQAGLRVRIEKLKDIIIEMPCYDGECGDKPVERWCPVCTARKELGGEGDE